MFIHSFAAANNFQSSLAAFYKLSCFKILAEFHKLMLVMKSVYWSSNTVNILQLQALKLQQIKLFGHLIRLPHSEIDRDETSAAALLYEKTEC